MQIGDWTARGDDLDLCHTADVELRIRSLTMELLVALGGQEALRWIQTTSAGCCGVHQRYSRHSYGLVISSPWKTSAGDIVKMGTENSSTTEMVFGSFSKTCPTRSWHCWSAPPRCGRLRTSVPCFNFDSVLGRVPLMLHESQTFIDVVWASNLQNCPGEQLLD